ncbi:hypothetical protein M8J75_007915 [Diaphorina citri]|nr:hypothetical protein M8J75_007915 [Diaphorina citri]
MKFHRKHKTDQPKAQIKQQRATALKKIPYSSFYTRQIVTRYRTLNQIMNKFPSSNFFKEEEEEEEEKKKEKEKEEKKEKEKEEKKKEKEKEKKKKEKKKKKKEKKKKEKKKEKKKKTRSHLCIHNRNLNP